MMIKEEKLYIFNDVIGIFYFMCNFIKTIVISKIARNEIMKIYRARMEYHYGTRNNTSDILEVQLKRTCRSANMSSVSNFSFFALFITNDVALTQFLAIAGISRVASLDDSMKT